MLRGLSAENGDERKGYASACNRQDLGKCDKSVLLRRHGSFRHLHMFFMKALSVSLDYYRAVRCGVGGEEQ